MRAERYQHKINQDKVSRKLNNDFIKIGKSDYKHPYELLLEDFKQTYKDSIIKCEAANLTVKLDLGVHTAERRIITPIDINFKELHEILQITFDWKECHLHEFKVIYDKNHPICIEGVGDAPPEDVGGISGYEEFLEIMANTKHPEYEGMKNWAERAFT